MTSARIFLSVLPVFAASFLCYGTDLKSNVPETVHPTVGTVFRLNELSMTLVSKKQNFKGGDSYSRDVNVCSPKSVNILDACDKFYINSLEGGTTVVYGLSTKDRLAVIRHRFSAADSSLWAPNSGYFRFRHPVKDSLNFVGKPVESALSHSGRYLWVPYYRRSFDLNAQEPSAMAVIDTRKDSIIRVFETGPLPKMVEVSPDGRFLAVTHWGNNTVGVMDISSPDPESWHYSSLYVVDYELDLKFDNKEKVDRDVGSGYCLRGTVFTPDSRYLLVGCMGQGGGVAVIDLAGGRYIGRVLGLMPNVRHILISDGYLYASINRAGYVQRIRLDAFLDALDLIENGSVNVGGWESCKVGAGARTIVVSPDGRYIFAACNFSSRIFVIKTETMTCLGSVPVDSYPVGLDISKEGTTLISTSQGREGKGGNAVDVFRISYSSSR